MHKSPVWTADGNRLIAQFKGIKLPCQCQSMSTLIWGGQGFGNIDDLFRRELIVNQQTARPFWVI